MRNPTCMLMPSLTSQVYTGASYTGTPCPVDPAQHLQRQPAAEPDGGDGDEVRTHAADIATEETGDDCRHERQQRDGEQHGGVHGARFSL